MAMHFNRYYCGVEAQKTPLDMGVSKNRGGPPNGWFTMENPIF